MFLKRLAALILVFLVACRSESRNVEITIRNDIQDQSFNQIVVDQIQSSSGTSSMKLELDPGDEISLPIRQITKFRVSRDYQDLTRIYVVSCPAKKDKVLIKLIDIHLNRLPGGCVMTKFGERKSGIINWKD